MKDTTRKKWNYWISKCYYKILDWELHEPSKKRNAPPTSISQRSVLLANVPLHLPIIQSTRGKCMFCYVRGTENNRCDVYLCLVGGNN